MNRAIEKEAAEALLDRGVSVPFKDIRLPFRKKPLKVRITMKRPTLAGQIEIGRQYLEMDTTAEEVRTLPKLEQMRFMARHGKRLSRIIAFPPSVCGADRMARAQLRGVPVSGGRHRAVRASDGHRPFYEYYQIRGTDESDEAETEPKKEGELRTEYEGSHSPFGFVWQIASATGWSVDYILHGVNYQTLIMMLCDAPRYIKKKAGRPDSGKTAEEEAEDIAGFFQSKLN